VKNLLLRRMHSINVALGGMAIFIIIDGILGAIFSPLGTYPFSLTERILQHLSELGKSLNSDKIMYLILISVVWSYGKLNEILSKSVFFEEVHLVKCKFAEEKVDDKFLWRKLAELEELAAIGTGYITALILAMLGYSVYLPSYFFFFLLILSFYYSFKENENILKDILKLYLSKEDGVLKNAFKKALQHTAIKGNNVNIDKILDKDLRKTINETLARKINIDKVGYLSLIIFHISFAIMVVYTLKFTDNCDVLLNKLREIFSSHPRFLNLLRELKEYHFLLIALKAIFSALLVASIYEIGKIFVKIMTVIVYREISYILSLKKDDLADTKVSKENDSKY